MREFLSLCSVPKLHQLQTAKQSQWILINRGRMAWLWSCLNKKLLFQKRHLFYMQPTYSQWKDPFHNDSRVYLNESFVIRFLWCINQIWNHLVFYFYCKVHANEHTLDFIRYNIHTRTLLLSLKPSLAIIFSCFQWGKYNSTKGTIHQASLPKLPRKFLVHLWLKVFLVFW